MFKGNKIVCICGELGNTKGFLDSFVRETYAGNIVIFAGFFGPGPDDNDDESLEATAKIATLNLRKIDLCDEVLVIDDVAKLSEEASHAVSYAEDLGKTVRKETPKTDNSSGKQPSSPPTL